MNVTIQSRFGRALYEALPEVYRTRDDREENKGHLAAYLDSCGKLLDAIYNSLDQRYKDCFPETCQEWLLPYFAQLVGATTLSPLIEGRRKEIMHAVAWRQGKGTIPTIGQIAEGIGGFEKLAAQEGWPRVARTARIEGPSVSPPIVRINRIRHDDSDHPKEVVRPADFVGYRDTAPHSVDVRKPDWLHGHANPFAVLLYASPYAGFFAKKDVVRFKWKTKTTNGTRDIDSWFEKGNESIMPSDLMELREDGGIWRFFRKPGVTETIHITGEKKLGKATQYFFTELNLSENLSVPAGTRLSLERLAAYAIKIGASAADSNLPALIANDSLLHSVNASGSHVRFEYCTVLGELFAERLEASDCIFMEGLYRTSRRKELPQGGIRYSRIVHKTADVGDSDDLESEPAVYTGAVLQNIPAIRAYRVLAPEGSHSGKSNDLSKNEVTLISGTVKAVFGAINLLDLDPVTGNQVVIKGGTVGIRRGGDIFGGSHRLRSGVVTASSNSVTISGGTINGQVIGGQAKTKSGDAKLASAITAIASDNSVTILGGTLNGSIVGASALAANGRAETSNNTVTIQGNPTFGAAAGLFGGYAFISGPSNNNALNLHSAGLTVRELNYFQVLNFYLPMTLTADNAMLTVTDRANLGTSTLISVHLEKFGPALQSGDRFVLISAGELTGTFQTTPGSTIGGHSYSLEKDRNRLVLVIGDGAHPEDPVEPEDPDWGVMPTPRLNAIVQAIPGFNNDNPPSWLLDNIGGFGKDDEIQVPPLPLQTYVVFELPGPFSRILFQWMSSFNYDYDQTLHGAPDCYEIQISSNSPDGNKGDWVTVVDVQKNPWAARAHIIEGDDMRWVRFRVTRGDSSINEIDIHDLSRCKPGIVCDTWGFIGDSITADTFWRSPGTGQPFNERVNAFDSRRYPSMINFGIGGQDSGHLLERLQQTIDDNQGIHFWAIGIGSNDGEKVAVFEQNLVNILDLLIAQGKQPIVARIPWSEIVPDSHIQSLNIVIDKITNKYDLPIGPDLYTLFRKNPSLLSDGLHPTAKGIDAIQELWAQVACSFSSGNQGIVNPGDFVRPERPGDLKEPIGSGVRPLVQVKADQDEAKPGGVTIHSPSPVSLDPTVEGEALFSGIVGNTNEKPEFFTTQWGEPGCGVIHPESPESIRYGAEDGGEMGAFHHCGYMLAWEAVIRKLDDYLPVGMRVALIPDTTLFEHPIEP